MRADEFALLQVGDVVREKQLGSTPKVILAFWPSESKALTKPQHAEHPERWVSYSTLRRRFGVSAFRGASS